MKETVEGWKTVQVRDLCDLGRGRVISSQEIERCPGAYPVFSSQSFNNGQMGEIDTFDFDGEYVTWTTDGAYAGTVFYRSGKFNCTNVCGTLAAKDLDLSMPFLAYKLSTLAKNYVSYVGNPKLMNGVMANIELSLPISESEQTKIAEILSTVDQAIEQTQDLIAKQQRVKTGLTQDILTRGIDEHGNLRGEQTHQFKNSPLGRIPVKWDVAEVGNIAKISTGGKDTQDRDVSGMYPFFVRSQTVEKINSFSFDGEGVLTAGDGVGVGKVFHYYNGKFDYHQRVYCMHSFADDMDGYFFFHYFRLNFMLRVSQFSAKGSVDSVRMAMITKMQIPKPSKVEQVQSVKMLRKAENRINAFLS